MEEFLEIIYNKLPKYNEDFYNLVPDSTEDFIKNKNEWLLKLKLRNDIKNFIYNYSWVLPTLNFLEKIQNFIQKEYEVLEIGAGTGLWSYLLSEMDIKIRAVDNYVWKDIQFNKFFNVENKTMKEIKEMIPNYKIIMMVWPTNKDDSSYEYLKLFTENGGEKLILIKDYSYPNDNITATEDFYNYLKLHYNISNSKSWNYKTKEENISPKTSIESELILADKKININ